MLRTGLFTICITCLFSLKAMALDLPEYEIQYEKSSGKAISIINKAASPNPSKAIIRSRKALDPKESESKAIQSSDSFLIEKGSVFGIRNVSSELHPRNFSEDSLGNKLVSYEQRLNGIPFCDKELLSHLNSNNEVKSVNGDISVNVNLDTTPKINVKRAIKIAKRDLETRHAFKRARSISLRSSRKSCRGKSLSTSENVRCVNRQVRLFEKAKGFSPFKETKLCIESDKGADTLVYKVSLADGNGGVIGNYSVDAKSGYILSYDNGEMNLIPKVFDCSYPGSGNPCTYNVVYFVTGFGNYTFGRFNRPTTPVGPNPLPAPYNGSLDVDNAYDIYIPAIHSYYLDKFGRNGANNQGGTGDGSSFAPYNQTIFIANGNGSTTGQQVCNPGYGWTNGYSIAFCRGSLETSTYDLLGHEHNHIVSKYMRPGMSLGTLDQPGALNEHMADAFGQFVESSLNNTPPDWIFGGGANVPIFRNLQDPPSLYNSATNSFYPDRFNSTNMYCGAIGGGGVHHNSTVPSKALYLATEGGEFNGCTIEGIGLTKTELIWYRALTTYFVPETSFNMAYAAFNQACSDLANPPFTINTVVPPVTITEADCDELKKALQAVEMDQGGACSGIPATTPECAAPEYSADFNGDGVVDLWDWNELRKNWLMSGEDLSGDGNRDEVVNIEDYVIWLEEYNQPDAPPAPSNNPDCDGDGDADGNDFLLWQRMLGSTGPAMPCDFNGDGMINGADLTIWRNGFGS